EGCDDGDRRCTVPRGANEGTVMGEPGARNRSPALPVPRRRSGGVCRRPMLDDVGLVEGGRRGEQVAVGLRQGRTAGREQVVAVGLGREDGEGRVRGRAEAGGVPARRGGLTLDDGAALSEEAADLLLVTRQELEPGQHCHRRHVDPRRRPFVGEAYSADERSSRPPPAWPGRATPPVDRKAWNPSALSAAPG